ncbi:MAG: chromosome segregation ATPase [Sphingobacteriales bacterium]
MILEKVKQLEQVVEQLLLLNQGLKSQIQASEKDSAALAIEIEEKNKRINALEEEVQYFQLARGESGGQEEVKKSKLRINELVKEIDKCIALLNH